MDTLALSTRLLNEHGLPHYSATEQAGMAVRLLNFSFSFSGGHPLRPLDGIVSAGGKRVGHSQFASRGMTEGQGKLRH